MKYYSISEVAPKLQKSRQWIWILIISGKLNASKVGNQYVISEDDLNKFLSQTTNKGEL